MAKEVSFGGHFSFGRIYKRALAPVIMMVFSSIYSIVDGVFVSNVVGTEAFAAVIVSESLTAILSLSFLLGKHRYGSNFVTKREPKKRLVPVNKDSRS